ncbi:Branched-chain alpha-keto acid dehydrogenase E2 component (fragment) [uncultured Sphingopyxis sp.]|uniref:Branched-chain alpha-keto acid dehydrogenase E2 component n=1 Tax=uncultured Sphingopyxis sp. TaxID=310581 RepID=A0A1Y5PT46_9SPHN
MARYSFRLPDIGEGIAEAEIVAWHVRVGERVEEDAQLADMMTDKATVEMESPVSGVVVELAGEVGDMVAIGSTLAVIETDGEAAEAPAEEAVEEAVVAETPGPEEVSVAEEAPLPLAGGAGGGPVEPAPTPVINETSPPPAPALRPCSLPPPSVRAPRISASICRRSMPTATASARL